MQNKIKFFRNSNIIHFLVNSIIGGSHIIIYLKLFWISNNAKVVYYYIVIIIFSFGLIPIILAIFITIKKITKNIMNILKLLIKYFILLEILICIISSVSLSENQRELSIFFYSCPFNYEINDIDKIFDFYNSENNMNIQEKCQNRRCFFNEKLEDLNDIYLCNFNYKLKKKQCSVFDDDKINKKLINYFYYCENFVTFFKCPRPDKELKKLINNYDYVCPNQEDEIINIILLYIFLIIDIVFLCTPWLIEIVYIDEIIFSLYNGNNNINSQNNNSLKETDNTSQEQSDIEHNNNNFQRQPTEIIIVDNSENNMNNIIYNMNKKDILNINQHKINSDKNNEKNINNLEDNKSKSDIQLMQNQNNNIFKTFNNINLYKNGKK